MLNKVTLSTKILVLFLLIGILPALTVGIISYINAQYSLKEQNFNQLISIREIKKQAIEELFDKTIKGDILSFSRSLDVKEAFKIIRQYHIDTKVTPKGNYDVDTDKYKTIKKKN